MDYGTIVVRINGAVNFPLAFSSCYVAVHVGDSRQKTTTRRNGASITWNETLVFQSIPLRKTPNGLCSEISHCMVEVWSHDGTRLCGIPLEITSLTYNSNHPVTVKLNPLQSNGELFIDIETVDFGLFKESAARKGTTISSQGVLRIKLEKGAMLQDVTGARRSKAIVTMSIAGVQKQSGVKEGFSPSWNQTFILNVSVKQIGGPTGYLVCDDRLLLEVGESETTPDSLGKACLDLLDMPFAEAQEIALPLNGDGKLYMTLEAIDFGTPRAAAPAAKKGPPPTPSPRSVHPPAERPVPTPTHPAVASPSAVLKIPSSTPYTIASPPATEEYWNHRKALDESLQHEERRLRKEMLARMQGYEESLKGDVERKYKEISQRLEAEVDQKRDEWQREIRSQSKIRQLEREQWAAERQDYERERKEWEFDRERWLRERQSLREDELREWERREKSQREAEGLAAKRHAELEERHRGLHSELQRLLADYVILSTAMAEKKDVDPESAASRKDDLERLLEKHHSLHSQLTSHGQAVRGAMTAPGPVGESPASVLAEERIHLVKEREEWMKQRAEELRALDDARAIHNVWLQQRDKERQSLSLEKTALELEKSEFSKRREYELKRIEEQRQADLELRLKFENEREAQQREIGQEMKRLHEERERISYKLKDILSGSGEQ